MVAKVRTISDIVATSGLPLADVAVRFCVSNPHVTVTIPGIRTPEQAKANAAACVPLPAAMLDQLRRLA
jgi:aryl-alcohol dehydrogenase-like predicted oxidoreductase